jgi:hypothetical protein
MIRSFRTIDSAEHHSSSENPGQTAQVRLRCGNVKRISPHHAETPNLEYMVRARHGRDLLAERRTQVLNFRCLMGTGLLSLEMHLEAVRPSL